MIILVKDIAVPRNSSSITYCDILIAVNLCTITNGALVLNFQASSWFSTTGKAGKLNVWAENFPRLGRYNPVSLGPPHLAKPDQGRFIAVYERTTIASHVGENFDL
jgi:hypothetical protein